jgi:hypothetical protein
MVSKGLADHAAGVPSPEAALVVCAASRLRRLGYALAEGPPGRGSEEILYERLGRVADDPYARYNAMLRELDSFLEAATARRRRAEEGG